MRGFVVAAAAPSLSPIADALPSIDYLPLTSPPSCATLPSGEFLFELWIIYDYYFCFLS